VSLDGAYHDGNSQLAFRKGDSHVFRYGMRISDFPQGSCSHALNFMRLTLDRLVEITGLKRKTAQARWFRIYLSVDVPMDRIGIIMTDTAYEKLLEKRLGLGASLLSHEKNRPSLRP